MTAVGTLALLIMLLANFVAVIWVGILARRSNRMLVNTVKVVHLATNSMKDELVAEVRKASHAQGHSDAEDEATARGDVRGKN